MEEPGPCLSFCKSQRVKLSASLTLFSGPDLPGTCFKPPSLGFVSAAELRGGGPVSPRVVPGSSASPPDLEHTSLTVSSSPAQGASSPRAGAGDQETSGLQDLKASLEPRCPFSVPMGLVFPSAPAAEQHSPTPQGCWDE